MSTRTPGAGLLGAGRLTATAVLAALSVCPASSDAGSAGPRTLGFTVTYLEPARSLSTALDCPSGFNVGPNIEATLARYPESERQRIRDNRLLLYRALMHRGPTGPNICLHPTAEPDPGYLIGQSTAQRGLDLQSGLPAGQACDHPRGTDPETRLWVDNQFNRVQACTQSLIERNSGAAEERADKQSAAIVSGTMTVLLEVRGVDDLKNDPDVELGIYSSADPVMLEKSGKALTDATFHVLADRKFQTVVHGHIENGVLTTDYTDISVLTDHSVSKLDGARHTLDWKLAQIRLKFQEDGSVVGILGGYADWEKVYERRTRGGTASLNNAMGSVSELQGNFTCSGYYNALRRAADAFPDPQTGQCTRISTVYDVRAVPAFIVHPHDSATKVAHN